jgi:hypothetical protein
MIDGYSISPKDTQYDRSDELNNNSDLINEFDPNVDPLGYLFKKEELSFERTKMVSERRTKNNRS